MRRRTRHHYCEYNGCKRRARYKLVLKDGTVLARYCKKHYEKVMRELHLSYHGVRHASKLA